MARKRFPIFWTIVLLFGIAWLLNELGYLNVDIPWGPVILIVVAGGFVVNRLFLK